MTRFACLVAAMLFAASAAAQSGSLGGTVLAGGRPGAGVSVTAHSDLLQQSRSTTSTGSGAWSIAALPAGTYDVTFVLAGHQTFTHRTEVREGEQSRVDATLEPSTDEESVTRTAIARSIAERPAHLWSVDRDVSEALPLGRLVTDELALAPGSDAARVTRLGGIVTGSIPLLNRDAIRSAGEVFAAPSAENPAAVALLTPNSGGIASTVLRSTLEQSDDRTDAFHELSGGGPLAEAVWIFLSAAGDADRRLVFANAELTPTARDSVSVIALVSDAAGREPFGATWTHARERLVTTATAGNTTASIAAFAHAFDRHEIAAGVERFASGTLTTEEVTQAFIRDRWRPSRRLVVEAGARIGEGAFSPRVGAAFDLTGSGRTKLVAAYSETFDPLADEETDESLISIARALGSNGYARVALVRTDGNRRSDAVVVDAQGRYLFLAYGASITLADDAVDDTSHAAGWLQADLPTIGYHVSLALLERWRPGGFATDLALRYALERELFSPFVQVDVVNVFETDVSRLYRMSVGIRR